MKRCKKCGESKALSEFNKNKLGSDGLASSCKSCKSKYNSQRYDKQSSSILKQQADKYATQDKVKSVSKYVKANPNKHAAHIAVSKAIKLGKLVRQLCECCGSDKTAAHHDDYSKPLEVRWLCRKHHGEWHRINGEALNG